MASSCFGEPGGPGAPLRLVIDGSGGGRLYSHGILVPGVRRVVSHPGGDVMLIIAETAIVVDETAPAPAGQDNIRLRLATDGQA